MSELPVLGRNWMALAMLAPGARTNNVARTPVDTRGPGTGNFQLNLDGQQVTQIHAYGQGQPQLSRDNIAEFEFVANRFDASQGRSTGVQVNAITKSGTNTLTGSLSGYFRDERFNAADLVVGRVLPYSDQQLSSTFGGPIRRDRIHFFANYEYTNSKSPLGYTATFPTLEQRDGDFSKTFNTAGKLITIYNPFDTFINASGAVERRPFPGNIIPQSMFDPVIAKVLPYFPKPNQVTNALTNTNNWFAEDISLSPSQKMDFKGDHNFNEKTRLTGRFSHSRSSGSPPNLFGEGNPAYTFNDGPSRSRSYSAVADITRVENPTTLWTFRYGIVYSSYARNSMVPFDLTTLGFPKSYADAIPADIRSFPTITSSDFLGTPNNWWKYPTHNQTLEASVAR